MKIASLPCVCFAVLVFASLSLGQQNLTTPRNRIYQHGVLSIGLERNICTVRNALTGQVISSHAVGSPAPGTLPQPDTAYQFQTLPVPPDAAGSTANGISHGQITGGYWIADSIADPVGYAGLFSDNGFQVLNYPGAWGMVLNGINAKGDIVGDYLPDAPNFRYTVAGLIYSDGKFSSLTVHNGSTILAGISDGGQIVGGYNPPAAYTTLGFLLANSVITDIRFPNSTYTFAAGVNEAEEVVGEYGTEGPFGGYFGFTYMNGIYTSLQVPGGTGTFAESISNNGMIAGSYLDSAFNGHGFVLNNGQFTTIDYPGAKFTGVSGIEDSGRIVGQYVGPSCPLESQNCGFVAMPQ